LVDLNIQNNNPRVNSLTEIKTVSHSYKSKNSATFNLHIKTLAVTLHQFSNMMHL